MWTLGEEKKINSSLLINPSNKSLKIGGLIYWDTKILTIN